MKSALILGLAALTFGLGSASAADLTVEAPEPAAPAATVYNWTGIYAGINGGYGWGDVDASQNSITTSGALVGANLPGTFTYPGDDTSDSVKGWLGGGQLGFNYQTGAVVLGVEGDYQASGIDASSTMLGSPAGPYYEKQAKIESFGTIRGRVGYALDNVLLYGTGGVAIGQVQADVSIQGGTPGNFTGPQFSDSDSQTMVGFVIGAGAEWAIAHSKWSVKAEYLYTDFGSKTFNFEFPGAGGDTATGKLDVTSNIVRAGLNYRF